MAVGRQNTRATCPKDKLKVAFFNTKSHVLWKSQVVAAFLFLSCSGKQGNGVI